MSALFVVIILLVLLIAYKVWNHKRHWRQRLRYATPDCSKGAPVSQLACQAFTSACHADPKANKSQVSGCMNAVAHCMPVFDGVASAQSPADMVKALGGTDLQSCSAALTSVDPEYAARLVKAYGGGKACTPPEMASLYSSDADYRALLGLTEAGAPLVPYALRVAKNLPACSSASASA
jgi:hypothetical protein